MHEIKLDEALRKGKSSVLRDLLDNEAVIKDTGRYSNPPPAPTRELTLNQPCLRKPEGVRASSLPGLHSFSFLL